MCLKVNN